MGAWPSRTVQLATAEVLNDTEHIGAYMRDFKELYSRDSIGCIMVFVLWRRTDFLCMRLHRRVPFISVQFNVGRSDEETVLPYSTKETAVVPFTRSDIQKVADGYGTA